MPITTNYTLNTKQLSLLRLLYRFRFSTSQLLAIASDIKQDTVNQRLQILLDQQYIGRHYDGQYKIHGRPAEYYLLENGIKALKQHMPDKCNPKVLHAIYKDKNAKPSFVAHCLAVFSVYCSLKKRYNDTIRFFTKSQVAEYAHFPKQLPDALIRLDVDGERKEFFLEVIDPNKPFFSYVGKIKRYMEYSDDGIWQEAADTTGAKLPVVLVVGDTTGTAIRFQKQAGRLLGKHYDKEPRMFVAAMDELAEGYDRVWRDVEEPKQAVALAEVH